LIRRVYAYVAYRIGDGPDAEDVTSEVFERALRYGDSYDAKKGDAIAWLLGIARRCASETANRHVDASASVPDVVAAGSLEEETISRLLISGALATLSPRDRDLIALRFGADLTAAQIAKLVGERTNTVEVALHRALERLRPGLAEIRPERTQAGRPRRRRRLGLKRGVADLPPPL
jgi:RNA polymerase sigma-70 factor (ECF subfamily)